MKRLTLPRIFPSTAILAVLLASALPACASLGGTVTSVAADQTQMKAKISVTHADDYDLHQIQSPSGTTVNEYVSPEGKVFAVTWHGQFPPQMQQVLGPYYAQYVAALQAQEHHYGHRPLDIQLPGLVIQTGGHTRAYYGRAYVPDLLPSGVQADEIR